MSRTNFQISTRQSGIKRVVKVSVYDDIKHLRLDCARHDKNAGRGDETYEHTLGIAHRFERINVETDVSHELVGHIRLHKPHLRTGIIAHEVAHIALWIYETDNKNRLSTEDIENEEIFCHILGELTARLVNKLYEKKLL